MTNDNSLNVIEQTEEKQERFFRAWKRGVAFVGDQFFGPKIPDTARTVYDLTPNRDCIEAFYHLETGGSRQLLAAMASFYDPFWAAELIGDDDDPKSLGGLIYNLDHQETAILCELIQNFCGWELPPDCSRQQCGF